GQQPVHGRPPHLRRRPDRPRVAGRRQHARSRPNVGMPAAGTPRHLVEVDTSAPAGTRQTLPFGAGPNGSGHQREKVVMNDQPEAPGRRIVVGVDGSPQSKAALRWAMTQAPLIGATVEATIAWQNPSMDEYCYGSSTVIDGDQNLAAIAEKVLAETIAEVAGEQSVHVETQTHIIQGHPAEALVDAATGAQLLV